MTLPALQALTLGDEWECGKIRKVKFIFMVLCGGEKAKTNIRGRETERGYM